MVEANVTYYNDMFRSFPGRVRGGPLDRRIPAIGPLVARVSRIAEPFVARLLRDAARGAGPIRVLDVGCGAGLHLRTVLEANPAATGVGLDLDPAVVSQCRENLEDWGLSGRVEVLEGDIQAPPEEARGPFDLVLLLSVVYYLPVPQRVAVLTDLRQRLSPGGVLVVITSCRGEDSDLFSANLNLATSSMEGLTPLPEADEMEAQLREAGFTRVRRERLIAGTTYFGFRAT